MPKCWSDETCLTAAALKSHFHFVASLQRVNKLFTLFISCYFTKNTQRLNNKQAPAFVVQAPAHPNKERD